MKLHNYGLYYMTDHGREVNFPIGYVQSFEVAIDLPEGIPQEGFRA